MPREAGMYCKLGWIKREQGDLLGARSCFEASLALERVMGNTLAIKGLLEDLAELAEEQDQAALVAAASA